MPRKEETLKKIAEQRMGEMFGGKEDLRGLNAFFPKTGDKHALSKKNTVSKTPTVPKKAPALKTGVLIKPAPQLIYLKLCQLTDGQNKTIAGPLGYTEIAQLCNISTSTVRRAIKTLTQKGLIERIEIKNEKEVKGSKYRLKTGLQNEYGIHNEYGSQKNQGH